jgi:hypothetical protein
LKENIVKTEEQIKERIKEVDADERLHYPSASVFVNAPLALIQIELAIRLQTLKWVLEGGKE